MMQKLAYFVTDPQQVIEDADAIPDYNFGATLSARYKGLDFSIVFNGAGGHQVLNVTDNSYSCNETELLILKFTILRKIRLTSIEGDISLAPPALSSQALEDGDFITIGKS